MSAKQPSARDYEAITARLDSPSGGLAAIRARNGVIPGPEPVITTRPARPAAVPRPRPETPMTTPTTAPTSHLSNTELVSRARAIGAKPMLAAIARIDDAIIRLRALVADHDSKDSARRDVERLEAQLADAKAKLRGGVGTVRATPTGGRPCAKGCGRILGTGRASHEARCTGTAA